MCNNHLGHSEAPANSSSEFQPSYRVGTSFHTWQNMKSQTMQSEIRVSLFSLERMSSVMGIDIRADLVMAATWDADGETAVIGDSIELSSSRPLASWRQGGLSPLLCCHCILPPLPFRAKLHREKEVFRWLVLLASTSASSVASSASAEAALMIWSPAVASVWLRSLLKSSPFVDVPVAVIGIGTLAFFASAALTGTIVCSWSSWADWLLFLGTFEWLIERVTRPLTSIDTSSVVGLKSRGRRHVWARLLLNWPLSVILALHGKSILSIIMRFCELRIADALILIQLTCGNAVKIYPWTNRPPPRSLTATGVALVVCSSYAALSRSTRSEKGARTLAGERRRRCLSRWGRSCSRASWLEGRSERSSAEWCWYFGGNRRWMNWNSKIKNWKDIRNENWKGFESGRAEMLRLEEICNCADWNKRNNETKSQGKTADFLSFSLLLRWRSEVVKPESTMFKDKSSNLIMHYQELWIFTCRLPTYTYRLPKTVCFCYLHGYRCIVAMGISLDEILNILLHSFPAREIME